MYILSCLHNAWTHNTIKRYRQNTFTSKATASRDKLNRAETPIFYQSQISVSFSAVSETTSIQGKWNESGITVLVRLWPTPACKSHGNGLNMTSLILEFGWFGPITHLIHIVFNEKFYRKVSYKLFNFINVCFFLNDLPLAFSWKLVIYLQRSLIYKQNPQILCVPTMQFTLLKVKHLTLITNWISMYLI